MTESQYGCVRYWRHLCGFSVCVFIWLCTMSIYWDVYIVCTHICLLYIYMSRCVSEHMCIHHVHFYVYLQKQSHDHERLCSYLRGLLACVVCLFVLTRITCWPHQQQLQVLQFVGVWDPQRFGLSDTHDTQDHSTYLLNPNTPSPRNMAQACWMSRDRNSSHMFTQKEACKNCFLDFLAKIMFEKLATWLRALKL